MERNPVGRDRHSLVGRVGLYREVQQINDVTDRSRLHPLRAPEARRAAHGARGPTAASRRRPDRRARGVADTGGSVRLPRDRRAVGVRGPGSHRHPPGRTCAGCWRFGAEELPRRVDQLEALGDLGQAVSASLDPDEVLRTILAHAVLISGTDGGSIFGFDAATELFDLRVAYGTEERRRRDDAPDTDRAARLARGSGDAGRPAHPGARHRAGDARRPPRRVARGGLAIVDRGPDPARATDPRGAWSCGGGCRAASTRRCAICWRPSPANRRWPS